MTRRRRKKPKMPRKFTTHVQLSGTFSTACGLRIVRRFYREDGKPVKNVSVSQERATVLRAATCHLCLVGVVDAITYRRDAVLKKWHRSLKGSRAVLEYRRMVAGMEKLLGVE